MKKSPKKILLMLGILTAFTIFAYALTHAIWYAPEAEVAPPQALAKVAEAQSDMPGHPIRISIPSISVDAKVKEVGITYKGNMATPSNFADVGWYKYGPLPGRDGSAVMAGHVDNGLSFPGVFKHLDDIKIGDDIAITTKEGAVLHFTVTDKKVYDFNASTEKIFSKKGTPTLRLITCTGTWIQDLRTHDKRLVVTAERISQ